MPQRITMHLSLEQLPLSPATLGTSRIVYEDDHEALARLMLEAYRGTTDTDGSETLADARSEITSLFTGDYGRFMPDDSQLLEVDSTLRVASLVTYFEGSPFLAFTMTHPDYKQQGLAKYFVTQSCSSLKKQGHSSLTLVVTEGNTPAQRLYEQLGFTKV